MIDIDSLTNKIIKDRWIYFKKVKKRVDKAS